MKSSIPGKKEILKIRMTVALKLKHPVTQKKKGRNTKHWMRKEGQEKQ